MWFRIFTHRRSASNIFFTTPPQRTIFAMKGKTYLSVLTSPLGIIAISIAFTSCA